MLEEKIIHAATQAFNEKGAKFTLAEVAKLAGISKKTIYTAYESKDALLIAMLRAGFNDIKVAEAKILNDPSLRTLEKIRSVIIVQPALFSTLNFNHFTSIKKKYPKIFKMIQVRIESDWEPTIALLEQGIQEGCIKPISIPVFKAMVEASIEHFLESQVIQAQPMGYQKALNHMMDILMCGIAK